MEPIEIIAQIAGIFGMAFISTSYLHKKHRRIVLSYMAGASFFFINFLLLGIAAGKVLIGAILNFIGIFHAFVFANRKKFHADNPIWIGVFVTTYLISYTLVFTLFGTSPSPRNFIVEALPVIGMTSNTFAFFSGDAKKTRRLAYITSPSWLIYDAISHSIGGVITESISLISITVGIIRHDLKKQKEETIKLDIEKIKEITKGAVSVTQSDDGYSFRRFNDAELKLYENRILYAGCDFYKKAFSTSGIQFEFETDARKLSMCGSIKPASSRKYYSFDVFVNGEFIGDIRNYRVDDMVPDFTAIDLAQPDFSGEFELGEGIKTVRVVFPWSAAPTIKDVSLIGASFVSSVKKSKKMLMYGDSITQGYDAESPSRAYAVALAYALDAEAYNKGIGGEIFCPELAAIKNDVSVDYITVAYGTNDWRNSGSKENFVSHVKEFYKNLSENYPDAKIFAISPIWRADTNGSGGFGEFSEVEETIKEVANSLKNVTFIHGFDLVPHDTDYFADVRLHPRNVGFDFYADNLARKIKECI